MARINAKFPQARWEFTIKGLTIAVEKCSITSEEEIVMTLKKVRARLDPRDRYEREQRAQALIQDLDSRPEFAEITTVGGNLTPDQILDNQARRDLRQIEVLRIYTEVGLGEETLADLRRRRVAYTHKLLRVRSDIAILRRFMRQGSESPPAGK